MPRTGTLGKVVSKNRAVKKYQVEVTFLIGGAGATLITSTQHTRTANDAIANMLLMHARMVPLWWRVGLVEDGTDYVMWGDKVINPTSPRGFPASVIHSCTPRPPLKRIPQPLLPPPKKEEKKDDGPPWWGELEHQQTTIIVKEYTHEKKG